MNLIHAGEGLPLAPSICFICEQSPQEDCVDTFRQFETHLPTKLTGRKYVCEGCVRDLAKVFGMVDRLTYHAALEDSRHAEKHLAHAMLRVEQLEAVHVQTLKDLLAKATKPAPARKEVKAVEPAE